MPIDDADHVGLIRFIEEHTHGNEIQMRNPLMELIKDITKRLTIKQQTESDDEYKKIMTLAAMDGVIIGNRAVVTIIIFEVLMIISTFTREWDSQRIYYIIAYVFLIFASVIAIVLMNHAKKDKDKFYLSMKWISFHYALSLMVWAVYMTVIDNISNPHLSLLVFITVMVIIPIVTFVEPYEYLVLNILGVFSIYVVIWRMTTDGKFGNYVNFSVFALISLISGMSFFGIRLNSYKRQVQLANKADRDELSKLYNRQMLGRVADTIWQKCRENEQPLSCVLCDIDDFKKINDTFGHLTGDHWIKAVASVIQDTGTGINDLSFRYGGEEFMIIMPDCGQQEAISRVAEIQNRIKAVEINPGMGRSVTLSFGIYTDFPQTEKCEMEQYFSKADDLMYSAKRNGKNQYCENK